MIFGYLRVSTKEQNVGRQVEKMLEKGVDERNIYIDKVSGAIFQRFEYNALKARLREGDLIYFDALDRLGRDYDLILKEWKYITREIGADIVILENENLFDSKKFKQMGDLGKVLEDQFLSMLAYVAERQLKEIRRLQAEGIALAKKNGKHLGRPRAKRPKDFSAKYKQWKAGHLTATECMKLLGLKRTKFYEFVKEYEIEKGIKN